MNNTQLYKDIIIPIVTHHLPHAKIILYGSRARGDHHEGADIDVALDTGNAIGIRIMSDIMGDLEESRLPIPFDVVDFQAVSDDVKKEIIKDGIVWKE